MSIFDNFKYRVRSWLDIQPEYDARIQAIKKNRAYVSGVQKRTLKVDPGKTDDNVTINVVGLIVDRQVSWLFGRGVEFDLPGDEASPEQDYIDATWKANHKSILLHKLGEHGALAGTAYIKILDGDEPRLIALDPQFVTIDTDPEDVETVIRYTVAYSIGDTSVKEVSENVGGKWIVTKYTKRGNSQEVIEDMGWSYDFPPIAHCQNMPESDSVYGVPDIGAPELALQDAINLVASNTNKAIRLHSAPQLWGKKLGSIKEIISGTSKIIDVGEGELFSIEMSEMVAASNFLQWLVKQEFNITRTVDLDSIADKLGQLTNFGLHVLYEDTITKMETKRELYGELLTEVNRRLLVIGGFANIDAGKVNWPYIIPVDEIEETSSLQQDLNMGIVSKETVAMKRGYDYAVEQEKIAKDKTSEGNIGEALLNAFNRGNQIQ